MSEWGLGQFDLKQHPKGGSQWSASSMDIWGINGISGGSDGKASVCNAGDPGSMPGLGRSPGKGNGNPLQYSCLENLIEIA